MRIKRSFAVQVVTDPVEALRRVVYGGGALEACADAVGVSHQTLSKQLNEEDGNGPSLRRAAAIEQFMGSDALAECFAARRGGLFIKLPSLQAFAGGALVQDYAKFVSEFAEASKVFSDGMADGKLSRDEVLKFQKELRDVYTAGEQLVRDALARVEEA